MGEEKKLVGKVVHFYNKIGVAIVDLQDTLNQGDMISIEGSTTSLQQSVDSMQIEHKELKTAKKGQSIGLKVNDRVKEGDSVYRVVA